MEAVRDNRNWQSWCSNWFAVDQWILFSATEEMFEVTLAEYKETFKKSNWMDDYIKSRALDTAKKIVKFIGYHENLRSNELLQRVREMAGRQFLGHGLVACHVQSAILQRPNFDKTFPAYMNFGAIGTCEWIRFGSFHLFLSYSLFKIIGHEITHLFDNLATELDTWPDESKRFRNSFPCWSNLPEFAVSWNCSIGSNINPIKKSARFGNK